MARSYSPPTAHSQTASAAPVLRGSPIVPLLLSLRPDQWTKNLIVLAPLVFGGRLLEPWAIWTSIAAVCIFCALSSAVYLVNDVVDRETDQRHPLKRARPVAAGKLSTRAALIAAVLLGTAAMTAALGVGASLALTAGIYTALLLLYTAALKHYVIIDVLVIAAGFVIRAVAGAVAVAVPISQWLLVCATLLALFLALSKRRHELTLLAEAATGHRRALRDYSPYLLDQMIAVVTASTLIAYSVYATSPDTAARLGTVWFGLTIPFVLYGIFRYLYLVHQKSDGGDPATTLMTDRPLLACVALWALAVAMILYSPLGR